MVRALCFAALIGFVMSVAGAADDDKKPEPGKGKFGGKGGFDKGKMFEKMDANGDGKLSKEEYTKFFEGMAERMKDKGGDKGGKFNPADMAAKGWEKLDPKGTGTVTKEEFEKSGGFGGGPGGPGGFKGKGKGGEGKGAPKTEKGKDV